MLSVKSSGILNEKVVFIFTSITTKLLGAAPTLTLLWLLQVVALLERHVKRSLCGLFYENGHKLAFFFFFFLSTYGHYTGTGLFLWWWYKPEKKTSVNMGHEGIKWDIYFGYSVWYGFILIISFDTYLFKRLFHSQLLNCCEFFLFI